MATLQLTELLIDATLAKLRSGLPARIAAINAEKGDFTIEPPSPEQFVAFGAREIFTTPTLIVTQGDDAQIAEEGPHALSIADSIIVAVVEQEADPDILGRKLLRLARATAETIWDDDPAEMLPHTTDPNLRAAHGIYPVRLSPGRVFPVHDDDGAFTGVFRSIYTVEFEALRVEN